MKFDHCFLQLLRNEPDFDEEIFWKNRFYSNLQIILSLTILTNFEEYDPEIHPSLLPWSRRFIWYEPIHWFNRSTSEGIKCLKHLLNNPIHNCEWNDLAKKEKQLFIEWYEEDETKKTNLEIEAERGQLLKDIARLEQLIEQQHFEYYNR